jgi:hypothetical protein
MSECVFEGESQQMVKEGSFCSPFESHHRCVLVAVCMCACVCAYASGLRDAAARKESADGDVAKPRALAQHPRLVRFSFPFLS